MTNNIPLTSSDLREIAKTLDSVVRVFGEDPDAGGRITKFGGQFSDIRLDVVIPGIDEVIGSIGYYDGWLGFRFGKPHDPES